MNTIKCEALVVVIAVSLAVWLVGGCKEAVDPIQPVQTLHGGEQEDPEEARRKPPSASEEHDQLQPPVAPDLFDLVDDLDEAVKLAEGLGTIDTGPGGGPNMDVFRGIRSLGEFLAKGTPAERRAALETLREILLHANEPVLRSGAVEALGRDFERTYPLLLQALNDKDPGVLRRVLRVLPRHAGNISLIRRVRELLDHPDYKVSDAAASVLVGMYEHAKNVTGLISLLGVYEHDLSAKAAIRLSVMGRDTVPALIHALKTSPNADQRHGAAMVLAMLCGGVSPKQQKFAALAYVDRGPAYEEPVILLPLRKAVEPLIDALLQDDSAKVREISAQGLGYLGDKRAARALAQALTEDPSEAVRRRAAAALITVPAGSARPALEKAARTDEAEAVRRYAAEALGWIGSLVVIPVLVDLTEDEAAEVRRYAAVQLGRLAEEGELSEKLHGQALLGLVRLFDDSNPDVRWAAVMAVGRLRDKAAVGLLVKAIDDPAPMVSHAAERGLQKLGLAERKADEFKKYYE